MKRIFFFYSLLFLFLSCSNTAKVDIAIYGYPPRTTPIIWRFHCSFDKDFEVPVYRAIAYWDDLTPLKLFTQVDCTEASDLVIESSDDFLERDGILNLFVFGTGSRSRIRFYFPFKWDANFITRINIARHEVGHSLGFKHTLDDRCLMYKTLTYPYNHRYKRLCRDELIQFLVIYGH